MAKTDKKNIDEAVMEETDIKSAKKEEDISADQETYSFSKKDFDKIKKHVETIKSEKEEAIALAQRLQADFDNYRKRNSSLRIESYEEGKRDCIKTLLPVIDNFERALQNSKGVDEDYVEGIRLLNKLLLDTLNKQGLKEIDAGGSFNPELHDAVMQEAVEGKKPGEIIDVLQTGYEVNGKILRHSMVKVAE